MQSMSWEETVLDGMLTTRKGLTTDKELDDQQPHVIQHMKDYRSTLAFERLFEALTAIGLAPALVYDDNGMFAISDCGLSKFKKADEKTLCGHRVHCNVYADENLWRPNVRAAMNAYIDML